jgi:hypothetical protein
MDGARLRTMGRDRVRHLVVASVLLCGLAVTPVLAACGQDRPAAVIGLAESTPPQEDEASAEPQPETDAVEDEPVDEPQSDAGVVEDEPVDEPQSDAGVVEDEPVDEPQSDADAAPDEPVDEPQPDTEQPIDEPQPDTDEPVDEPQPDTEQPIDETQPDTDEPIDEFETDELEELLALLSEGDLDEEQQDDLVRALEDAESDEVTIAATEEPAHDEPAAVDEPATGFESLQVESTPIGPMATVNVFTSTQPVGARLSVSLSLRTGQPAAGAAVVVLGQGLAPRTEVTVTVYSTPQVIAAGAVDEGGSALLDAVLPGGLDPGAHAIDVRATGADGAAVQSIGAFTIDADSIVVDVAPMGELLDPIQPDDPTLERALTGGVAVYDPARYPTVTVAAAIMAVAVVGLVGVSRLSSLPLPGAPAGGTPVPASTHAGPRKPARLSKLNARKMKSVGEGRQGWGDSRGSWRWPGTAFVDRMVQRVALRLGRVTELAARILDDGTWARAMFGSAGLATWLLGAVLGLVAASSVSFGAFPPAAPLILVIVAIGILDAMSGAIAWVVLAVGVVVTGQLGGWDDVRTMLGLFALYVAIPLAANAIRPLRRAPSTTAKERFDRFADYVAMPVLIAWAGTSMLLALNGLSGLRLVEDDIIGPMRWTIAVALVVRLAAEDLAAHGFPARVEAVHPPGWPVRSMPVQWASVAARVSVFVLVIEPFVGLGAITLIAAAVTAVPMLLRTVEDRLINAPWLYRYFPRGLASRLLTMVVAIYLAAWLLGQAATSEQTPEMFNWLLLPGVIVGVISAFGRDGRHWPDAWSKRWAGSLVWLVLAGLTVGAITVPLL